MHGVRTFFLALVPILFSGCIAPQNPSEAARLNAWMTRWSDVVQHKPIQRMAFTKNDRPVAMLQNLGWKDQTVYVEFIYVDSNQSVFHEGVSIARNELKYIGPTRPLGAGTYHLKVTPQNSAPLMQTFAVYGD